MSLKDMFGAEDTRTFEQRRDEVVSLVVQATDLGGEDQYLRRAVTRCRRARTEREFDQAYESIVTAISRTPLCA